MGSRHISRPQQLSQKATAAIDGRPSADPFRKEEKPIPNGVSRFLNLERAMGFEPTTTLGRLCSTPELRPRRVSRHCQRSRLTAQGRSFNEMYVGLLTRWRLIVGRTNPVARSNLCPELSPPAEPVLYASASRPKRNRNLRPHS